MAIVRANVLICAGSACVSSRAYEFKDALLKALEEAGIREEVNVVDTGCVGTCDLGPVAIVYPDGVFYVRLKPEDAKTIVNEHLLKGRVVNRLLYQKPMTKEVFPSLSEIDFVARQKRIVLRNMGIINPESIEEYIAREGYQALAKALTMTPEEVIDTVKRSGLRGRGGAGFPTGLKWELARKAIGSPKYVICNGDEGDPGAFMDRSILEGDPHSVIEGMMIAGYAIGASKGFFYVRAEYPLAIERLELALEQARSYGLIGENILGTGFSFDIELRRGSGAFVCGEETALIASIEGRRGEPRPRPPYPANKGLWDKPTVINNVETLANIAPIILNGAEWFSSIGTEKSKGTKVFALAGKVNNTGLIEVPFGTTLREIIFDVGGGIPGGKKFKAAQTGGPSGGCIPAEYLDLPLDYESLKQIGAIVGSGGLIIMDEDTCMVDVARFFLEFTQSESCGKCPPCRVGTRKMLDILERIINGEGEEGDIERLIELGNEIKQDSLCGLGQTAPNPVLSTIRFFRDEYEAHIKEKRCPAKSCRALIAYQVIPDKCRGCGICARICPVGAAQGKPREVHHIDKDLCIKCGDCFAKCPFGAIEKIDVFAEKS
jgi:NADP-reducing hydrogenase subunit HndC